MREVDGVLTRSIPGRRRVYRVLTTDRRDVAAIRVGSRLTQRSSWCKSPRLPRRRLWSYYNVLRADRLSYQDYLDRLALNVSDRRRWQTFERRRYWGYAYLCECIEFEPVGSGGR